MTDGPRDLPTANRGEQHDPVDAGPLALLRTRGYLSWFVQDTLSKTATSGWMFFVPLIVLALSKNETLSGAVLGMGTMVVTLVGLFGGTLVDRMNRRSALLAFAGGQGIVWAVVAILLVQGALDVWMLVVAIGVISVISGLFRSASGALLRAIVPPKQLPRAFANNQARDAVIELGAAPLVGVLFGFGAALAVAFTALSNVVAFGAAFRIKKQRGEVTRSGKSFLSDFVSGFVWLSKHLQLVRATLILAFGNFALTMVITSLQIHYFQLGNSAFVIGFIFTGAAVGMLLGSLIASSTISRIPVGKILMWSLVAVIMGTAVLGLAPDSISTTIVAMGFVGFVLPFVNSGIGGWTFSQIPRGFQGRVGGVSKLIFGFATSLAPLAAGLSLAHASFQIAILISCAAFLIALALTVLSPTIRSIGKPDEWVPVQD